MGLSDCVKYWIIQECLNSLEPLPRWELLILRPRLSRSSNLSGAYAVWDQVAEEYLAVNPLWFSFMVRLKQ